jgi:hypothetical protein
VQVAQDHPLVIPIAALLVIVAAWYLLGGKRWLAKVRRRRGGIYLVRTRRHHLRPRWLSWLGMRENCYVGLTVSYHFRQKDHLGIGRNGQAAQPWSDLDPVWKKVIPLPWFLCWHWLMNPLETLVIRLTWPRYNDAKNHWNPRRIPKDVAESQRLERDRVRAIWGVADRRLIR